MQLKEGREVVRWLIESYRQSTGSRPMPMERGGEGSGGQSVEASQWFVWWSWLLEIISSSIIFCEVERLPTATSKSPISYYLPIIAFYLPLNLSHLTLLSQLLSFYLTTISLLLRLSHNLRFLTLSIL